MTSTSRYATHRQTQSLSTPPSEVSTRELKIVPVDALLDRRSGDPVSLLSRRLNEACVAAVTSHQIAALLEADGLNDRIVAERFGLPSVFALAEELFRRVPLRRSPSDFVPVESESPVKQISKLQMVIRGPMYLAPLIFFLAVGEILGGRGMLVAGLVALLLAWSWNQGFGALTHRLIGRGDLAGAHRIARRSMFVGIVATSVVASVVARVVSGFELGDMAFAAGQATFLMGTATLLVFGYDRLLMVTVAPGLIVALISIASGVIPATVVVVATVLTPILIFSAALGVTRNRTRVTLPRMTARDRSLALYHALLGFLWATTIALAGLAVVGMTAPIAVVSIAASGMVLTMGIAEWQVFDLRRSFRTLLIKTSSRDAFATSARHRLGGALVLLALSLVLASLFVAGIATATGALSSVSIVLAVAYGLLGVAFFAGLVLVGMNRPTLPLVASIAFILEIGGILVISNIGAFGSAILYAMGCLVLAAILTVGAFVTVSDPVVHR